MESYIRRGITLESTTPLVSDVMRRQSKLPGRIKVGGQSMLSLEEKCFDNGTEVNCMYCLRATTTPVGIPVRRHGNCYNMVDVFCGLRCAYAEVKCRRDSIYVDSSTLLVDLWRRAGNDAASFEPAPDRRLLKIFNGPMTWEQFHDTGATESVPGSIRFVSSSQVMQHLP